MKLIAEKSPQHQLEGNPTHSAVTTFWASLTKRPTVTLPLQITVISWYDYPPEAS